MSAKPCLRWVNEIHHILLFCVCLPRRLPQGTDYGRRAAIPFNVWLLKTMVPLLLSQTVA